MIVSNDREWELPDAKQNGVFEHEAQICQKSTQSQLPRGITQRDRTSKALVDTHGEVIVVVCRALSEVELVA